MTATVTIKGGDAKVVVNLRGSSEHKSEDGKTRSSTSTFTTVTLEPGEEYTTSVYKNQNVSIREANEYDLTPGILDALDI